MQANVIWIGRDLWSEEFPSAKPIIQEVHKYQTDSSWNSIDATFYQKCLTDKAIKMKLKLGTITLIEKWNYLALDLNILSPGNGH